EKAPRRVALSKKLASHDQRTPETLPAISIKPRSAALTWSDVLNTFATSRARATRLVRSQYLLACFPRMPFEKSYSGRRSSVARCLARFFIALATYPRTSRKRPNRHASSRACRGE